MSENEKVEVVIVEWRTMEPIKWEPEQRRTDKMLVPPNTQRQAAKAPKKNDRVGSLSSDNSNITSIPKKPKSSKVPQSLVDSDFGYVSQQSMDQQDISSSSNEDFDNMEEMYMLEDATRSIPTATSWEALAAASKSMRLPKLKEPQVKLGHDLGSGLV